MSPSDRAARSWSSELPRGRASYIGAGDWQGATNPPPPKNKGKFGRSLSVGLRFLGLFCKNLLRVILTPPGRYQHPHDTSNLPVGRWGNCEPKWWPQGSTSCLLKNNIANTQGKKR
jgi:hypothetical protein